MAYKAWGQLQSAVKRYVFESHRDESPLFCFAKQWGVKRGNLYVEQSRIGNEGLPVPLKVSGWLQDLLKKFRRIEKWPHKEDNFLSTEPGLFYLSHLKKERLKT